MDIYNWDDLNVGCDNSIQFFARKHEKHEKLISTKTETSTKHDAVYPNSIDIQERQIAGPATAISETNVDRIAKVISPTSNVFTFLKPAPQSTNPKENCPKAYQYAEIYKNKREQCRKRFLNDEEKRRTFKSKPAPTFNIVKNKYVKKAHTIPRTPRVLRTWNQNIENRNKAEKISLKNEPKQILFKANAPRVLQKEPFRPVLENKNTEVIPFSLALTQRLEERKRYDEANKRNRDEKRIKELEEKQKTEEELVKRFRKQLDFHAQPNPNK